MAAFDIFLCVRMPFCNCEKPKLSWTIGSDPLQITVKCKVCSMSSTRTGTSLTAGYRFYENENADEALPDNVVRLRPRP